MGKEGKRIILAAGLSFLVLIGFQYFTPGKTKSTAIKQKAMVTSEAVAPVSAAEINVIKERTTAESAIAKPKTTLKGEDVVIETSFATVTLNTAGGAIKSWVLKDYKESGKPVDMVWKSEKNTLPGILKIPSLKFFDEVLYKSKKTETGVEFFTVVKGVVEITKNYSFGKEKFTSEITLKVKSFNKEVKNILDAKLYLGAGVNNHFIYNAKGVILEKDMAAIKENMQVVSNIYYVDEKLVKNTFAMKESVNEKGEPAFILKDDAKRTENGELSWIGIKDKYYISVFIPKKGSGMKGEEHAVLYNPKMETKANKEIEVNFPLPTSVLLFPAFDGEKGENISVTYYSGPIAYENLKSFKVGLHRAMELGWGWFNWFGIWMLVALKWCFAITKNWGVAIILITVLLKIITWWPTQKSYIAMKKMQEIQPEIAALKTKYKDNAQKMTEETMRIYKEKKVNPLGGCLPMLLQIPIFVAFYAVLANAIELKNASFLIWSDLSVRDPYFILLILMLVTMIIQQKMTPATDPQQAKMMMWMMPAVFAFIFWSLPAGLLLYFAIQNILSILQQWMVNRNAHLVS